MHFSELDSIIQKEKELLDRLTQEVPSKYRHGLNNQLMIPQQPPLQEQFPQMPQHARTFGLASSQKEALIQTGPSGLD